MPTTLLLLHRTDARPSPGDAAACVCGKRTLVRRADGAPRLPAIGEFPQPGARAHHVGLLDGKPFWLLSFAPGTEPAPEGWDWVEGRALMGALDRATTQALCAALELDWWLGRARHCGACGTPTEMVREERALRCPACGALFYPSPAPAIIVAVTRNGRLLLAHNRNFHAGRHSVLAGFVDPGESLEQAVRREVREETGIEIEDPRYVGSQPWPFPNSLMVAFRAEHRSGELKPDGAEIESAGWFAPEALPDIPAKGTVARELIDAWRSGE